MAVYRPIQISFWQKKFILKLTPEQKYFYIYLLTNSKTSQCGIYELPISVIMLETGYESRGKVTELLENFIQAKKIKYDYENEEVYILNWLKYNQVSNINIKKCVMSELLEVKNESFKKDFAKSLPKLIVDSDLKASIIEGLSGACKGLISKETEAKTETPTEAQVIAYFLEKGYKSEVGKKAFHYYSTNNWKDGNQKPVKNWKQKMVGVWFKPENKIPPEEDKNWK